MDDRFSGFPKAGLQFLRELKKNNNRDWFRERKHIYEEQVQRPMELLVSEVAAGCRKRDVSVFTKDKNPVMRVYRDIRFSSDKRPFKTHVSAGLTPPAARAGHGEVYIHVSPEESFLAAGFWMPERPFLRVWREAMTRDQARIVRVVKSLAKRGLKLSQEYSLKRLPRGFDQYADTEIADLLRLTSFVTSRPLRPAEYTSPGMVEAVVNFAVAAKPLLEYGWNLNYAPQRDILDER